MRRAAEAVPRMSYTIREDHEPGTKESGVLGRATVRQAFDVNPIVELS